MHQHDREWIQRQLLRVPKKFQQGWLKKYKQHYKKLSEDDSIPCHQRINAARFECNSRLREGIDKWINSSKEQ